MKKIIGVVGSGMIGRDPFDPQCWSGSSRNLFMALQNADALYNAVGVEVSKIKRGLIALKNYHKDRRLWRTKFNLDPMYYQMLTNEVDRKTHVAHRNDICFLQVGGIYDVPSVSKGNPCFSYHDGNIAVMMRSPMFPKKLLKYAEKAKHWEQEVYKKLDKIFVMSDYLRTSFIEDFGIDKHKVVNVGVGANFIMPSEKIVLNKDYSRQELLFIGIDFKRKGGEVLVDAFSEISKKYPSAVLHIVGPRELPKCVEGKNNIQFHGFLSRPNTEHRKKLFELLNRSTVATLPSLYEPFGIAVVESMSYGMPCIATNQWAFPEIISDDITGKLVEPTSVEQLYNAIDYYFSNEKRRKLQGRNARESVVNKFSWDRVAETINSYVNL